MHTVIESHAHHPVDASPQTTAVALGRLDPLHQLRQALQALGLDQVVSLHQHNAPASGLPAPVTFSATWALPEGHRGELSWLTSVQPGGGSGALISVDARAATDDPAAGSYIVTAWPLLSGTVQAVTTTLLKAVVALAEDLEELKDTDEDEAGANALRG